MSLHEPDKNHNSDYSKYDSMTDEVLRRILWEDLFAPEEESLYYEEVLYISHLLYKRSNGPKIDVQAAWESFCQDYMPLVQYYEEDGENDLYSLRRRARLAKRRAWLQHLASLAAVVLFCVMFAGTVTANALANPIITVVDLQENISELLESPPVTAELISIMAKNSDADLVPKWLPEGYELAHNKMSYMNGSSGMLTSRYFKLENGQYKDIFINFASSRISFDWLKSLYQDGFGNIELYSLNGVDYYIAGSNSRRTILWSNDGFYGCLVGALTVAEAKAIVDSIYWPLAEEVSQ